MNRCLNFPVNLFVYGTLMRGYSNHHLMQGCQFLGEARTQQLFALYIGSFPLATTRLRSDSKLDHVYGEVYSVPNAIILGKIDELEGHPDFYERIEVSVSLLQQLSKPMETGTNLQSQYNNDIDAYIYVDNKEDIFNLDVEFIESGKFSDSRKSLRHLQDHT